MIQRNSDHNIIKSLFSEEKHIPISERKSEMKDKNNNKKSYNSWEKVSSYKDNVVNSFSHNSISSACCGGISNDGGPNKQIKSEISNSIFDTNKISSIKETLSSREKTQEEKIKIAEQRRIENESYLRSKGPDLKDMPIDIPTKRASLQEGSKGWVPSHNISMFDNGDFDRLKDPAGELVKNKKREKDYSWKNIHKQTTSSDISERLYKNLTTNTSKEEIKKENNSVIDCFFNNIKKD